LKIIERIELAKVMKAKGIELADIALILGVSKFKVNILVKKLLAEH
jgi:hypothetical protein